MSEFERGRLTPDNPWPGLASYSEAEHGYFFGRELDAQDLLRLVRRETLTVLFGRSGLGKTSLLNAGLFPLLREDSKLPVYVRIDFAHGAATPVQQVFDALQAACERAAVRFVPAQSADSLWSYFQRRDFELWNDRTQPVVPVIIFDQFEEIFTAERDRKSSEAADFLAALAEVVENRPPAAIRTLLERHPAAASHFEFKRSHVKVVISLREDFLAELEAWKKVMPSLMDNRLRLLAMNGEQAYAAVTGAGGELVDDQIALHIIQLAWKNEPDAPVDRSEFASIEIDPALLSVVCTELNRKRCDNNPPLPRISLDLLRGADRQILSGFYKRSMEGCGGALTKFVEEELITSRGDRDSCDYNDALLKGQFMRYGVELLVRRRLLRIDERRGVRRLELAHDVLTSVVKESRDVRRAREAVERTQRKRTRVMFVALAVACLSMIVGYFRYQQLENDLRHARHDTLMATADSVDKSHYDRALLLHMEAMRASQDAGDDARLAKRLLAHPELLTYLRAHRKPVFSVAFSDDSELLVSSSHDSTVVIWDARTHLPLGSVSPASTEIYGVAFRPKTREFATANGDKGTVTLWDATTRTKIREFDGLKSTVVAVAFDRDGTRLAACDTQGNVIAWSVSGDHGPTEYKGASSATSLAFSSDGTLLAVGTMESTVVIWNVAQADQPDETLSERRSNGFLSVAFSPDGKYLAAGERTGVIDVWNVRSAEEEPPLQGHTGAVHGLAFSPDSRRLASSSADTTVMLWDVTTGAPPSTLTGHTGKVFGVAWSQDGSQLASASEDSTVILWKPDASAFGATLPMDAGVVMSLAYSPDGHRLAAGSGKGELVTWDMGNYGRVVLHAHDDIVSSIAFNADNTLLASGSWDHTVKLWAANAGAGAAPLKVFRHGSKVTCVAFSPDGALLAAADGDGVSLLDVHSGSIVAQLPADQAQDLALAFSPDRASLAIGNANGKIVLYDLRNGAYMLSRELSTGHAAVSNLAFSRDGTRLAAADWDGTVLAWNTATYAPPAVMEEHHKPVTGVAFGALSDELVSVGWDQNVILHDPGEKHVPVTIASSTARLQAVAFSPDGKQLASAGFDSKVRLWNIDATSLQEQACKTANRNLTHAEWTATLGNDETYHSTCADLPATGA